MRHIFLSFVSLFANVYYCLRYVKIRSRNISAFGEINYKKKTTNKNTENKLYFCVCSFVLVQSEMRNKNKNKRKKKRNGLLLLFIALYMLLCF